MDLQERFLDAVDYIEEHLGEPVSLTEAAKRAQVSPAHFSRLFRVLTGETFGSYVRQRRLTGAAEQLLEPEGPKPLIELAFDCQYDSQEAFTRAFKRAFGVTPGTYRERGGPSRVRWRERLDARALEHRKEVITMEPEIREIGSFVVVGLRERFDDETKPQIPNLWQRLIPSIPKIPHLSSGRSFGICLNTDTQAGSFDYVAGFEVDRVDELPEGLIAETIPSGTYAVFTHTIQGNDLHAELQPTMQWILGTWLPDSKHTFLNAADIEIYPPGFEPTPGNSLEICIPIRPAA